ncbi:MAG: hypothetical protein NTZ67_01030 [Gammaproteobacteria bacterium]|nr:hypothetical protein [Gammaproteobacteria bacterium]
MPEAKFISIDGKMKRNPKYVPDVGVTSDPKTTVADPTRALTIVSTMDDAMAAQDLTNKPMPENVQVVMEMAQEKEFTDAFKSKRAIDGGELLDNLSKKFAQHEVPIGLINQLMALKGYAKRFKCDDSGSTQGTSNVLRQDASIYMRNVGNASAKILTRWEEQEDRLHTLIDFLAYIPGNPIVIDFLNGPSQEEIARGCPEKVVLTYEGKTPDEFSATAHQQIRAAFNRTPSKTTPIFSNMQKMIDEALSSGLKTMHYLLTDGEPNNGKAEIAQIKQLLLEGRGRNPENNAFTFLSCSDNNAETNWMKELEEVAPFAAELDDFSDERTEVLKDQGPAFPYSRGFWLLCNLAAAINPHDLDAMDEDAPFTKLTMENLMGRGLTDVEYKSYFELHPIATRVFGADYQAFCTAEVARAIPGVQRYNAALLDAEKRGAPEADAKRIAAQAASGNPAGFSVAGPASMFGQQPVQGIVVQQQPGYAHGNYT